MVTYLIIINSVLLTLIVVLSGMFLWRKHLNRDSERRRFIFEFVADSPVLLYYAGYEHKTIDNRWGYAMAPTGEAHYEDNERLWETHLRLLPKSFEVCFLDFERQELCHHSQTVDYEALRDKAKCLKGTLHLRLSLKEDHTLVFSLANAHKELEVATYVIEKVCTFAEWSAEDFKDYHLYSYNVLSIRELEDYQREHYPHRWAFELYPPEEVQLVSLLWQCEPNRYVSDTPIPYGDSMLCDDVRPQLYPNYLEVCYNDKEGNPHETPLHFDPIAVRNFFIANGNAQGEEPFQITIWLRPDGNSTMELRLGTQSLLLKADL